MKVLNFIIFGALLCLSSVDCVCNFPPSLWCSSGEIAEQCGVYSQCVAASQRDRSAGPVSLTLYYESLCPDCKNFFKSQLYAAYEALGPNVVNLTLVPYGNARETRTVFGTWKFECQHGEQECIGNLIDTCSISLLKNVSVYFPFIHCMEGKDAKPAEAAKECAFQFGVELDPIMKCANGTLGNQLEHVMAVMTDALNPPHQYVPWVTLNGVHTEKMEKKAEENLLSLLCETYKGPTPPACNTRLDRSARCYHGDSQLDWVEIKSSVTVEKP